jgi:hypothetical protein
MITNTSATGCSSDAIVGEANSVLMIYDSDVEHNGNGFLSDNSDSDDIESNVFSNNVNIYNGSGYGLEFNNGSYSFIYGNTATGNGSCDAIQSSSISMIWADNTLGTTCGDVPASH